MTGLQHGPDLDRELALSRSAAMQTDPTTARDGDALLDSAFRAYRAIRPKEGFQEFMGSGFILEIRSGQCGRRASPGPNS
jgi:hypothetical protein